MIEAVLALHIDRARLDLNGPNLLLGPKAVLSLSMLLQDGSPPTRSQHGFARTGERKA